MDNKHPSPWMSDEMAAFFDARLDAEIKSAPTERCPDPVTMDPCECGRGLKLSRTCPHCLLEGRYAAPDIDRGSDQA